MYGLPPGGELENNAVVYCAVSVMNNAESVFAYAKNTAGTTSVPETAVVGDCAIVNEFNKPTLPCPNIWCRSRLT